MTHEEIVTMLEEAGLPLAYDHFAEGESPEPPFLIFLFPGTDNKTIEDILDSYDIPYEKSEYWIESEKMYEVLYQTEIIYGGN